MFGLKNLKDQVQHLFEDVVDFKKLCFQTNQTVERLEKTINKLQKRIEQLENSKQKGKKMNTISNINLNISLNYFQLSVVAIVGLLFLISAVRWMSKKPTGAVEVLLVVSLPVVLWFSNFFSAKIF